MPAAYGQTRRDCCNSDEKLCSDIYTSGKKKTEEGTIIREQIRTMKPRIENEFSVDVFVRDNAAFIGSDVGTRNPESRMIPVFVLLVVLLEIMNEAFVV